MSEDSWQGEQESPQTLNRYAYVTNDPVNYTDPTGHVGEGITVDDGENPDIYPGGDSGSGSGGTTVTIKDISNGNQTAIKTAYGSINKTSFNTAKAVVGTPKGTTVVKASAPSQKTQMSSQKMETAIKEIKNGSAMAIKKSLSAITQNPLMTVGMIALVAGAGAVSTTVTISLFNADWE